MATNYDKLRKSLFKKYSTNISSFCKIQDWKIEAHFNNQTTEISDPIYICPLCMLVFLEESLNQDTNNPLTLEDIPPKSLGGKPVLLTCKKCNNESGENLDIQIVKHSKAKNYLKGQDEIKIKLNVEGFNQFKTTSILDTENQIIQFNVPSKHQYADKQIEYLKTNYSKSQINFKFEVASSNQLKIALTRVAYLSMFSKFGSAFLFSYSSKKIRQYFQSKGESSFNPVTFNSNYFNDKPGVHLLKTPHSHRSFLVTFKTKASDTSNCIIIPGPYKPDFDRYNKINFKGKNNFVFISIDQLNHDFLNNPLLFNHLWNSLSKNTL